MANEKKSLNMNLLFGAGTALLAWVVLMVADAIDEYIIDESMLLGGFVYFGLPVVFFIWYAIHCVKNSPKAKALVLWFLGYHACFLPLWLIIGSAANSRKFFIEQKTRASFLDFNGIEYFFYGFSAAIAFTLLCLIFHGIRAFGKALKKGE